MTDLHVEAEQILRGANDPLPPDVLRRAARYTVAAHMRRPNLDLRASLADLGLLGVLTKTPGDPLPTQGQSGKRAVPGRMQSRALSPGV